MIDYEGELTVVMGTTCHNVTADEAMDYVAGYTLANDVRPGIGWRRLQRGRGFRRSLRGSGTHGKQLPGFTPCGPFLTTKDEIPTSCAPYGNSSERNIMQSTNTDDMIFKIPELISIFLSGINLNQGT